MAALMWCAVDEQLSFFTVAMPQMAGKSTTAHAALALRRPEVNAYRVAGEPELMERLKQERRGGYLVVDEFSRHGMPGYIWGAAVRRVFETLDAGYALQTTLHSDSPEGAIVQVTQGCGVSDEQAAAVKLVAYIEVYGRSWSDAIRRVVELYEVHDVRNGMPIGEPLFVWRHDGDRFERAATPRQFAQDRSDLERRAHVLAELAGSGRTDAASVADAVQSYRGGDS
jgi:hypothetical protein